MRSRMPVYIYALVFVVAVGSCTYGDKTKLRDVESVLLTCKKHLSCDSLDISFASVNSLVCTGDVLYIAPDDQNGLLSLDWINGNMESIELPMKVQGLFWQNDDIYAYSSYNPLWKYNVKNGIRSKANIPDSLFPVNHLSFFVKDSAYYFFSNLKGRQEAATIMNLKIKEFCQVGYLTTMYDDISYRFRSARHLLEYQDGFLSIGKFVPVIEQFDFNGNLKASFDMKTIPVVFDNLKEEFILKGRTPYFITTDCLVKKDRLYLLVRDGENNSSSKSIIEFYLKDSIEVKKHYSLTGSEEVSNFTIKEDTFVVFDYASSQLKFYPIEEK